MERNNSEIDRKSYPVLVIIATCLAAAFILTGMMLLHSLSINTTPEGRRCVKAVREYLKNQNPPVRGAMVKIDDIRPINDLGRFTDPEWHYYDTMKDSLYAVIRNTPPDLRGRKAYLSQKRTELLSATDENREYLEEQVRWLERLQGKELDGNVIASLHEQTWSFEKKSMELMREPGKQINVTVTSKGEKRNYVFVSPAGTVVLTDITDFVQ